MRVYLGSDHAGFALKQRLVEHVAGLGHEPVDCGPPAYDGEDDYPPYVMLAATRVAADPGSAGIVLGGSGNGEAIAANKVRGVRAALCGDAETASGARRWNDANVLALSLRTTSAAQLEEILDAWFAAAPSEDPDDRANVAHLDRLEQG